MEALSSGTIPVPTVTPAERWCKNALVIIPTYNEAENITEMITAIRNLQTNFRIGILVVDSNSPDGTGKRLEELKKDISSLQVLHQPRKMGLGFAYLDGFQYFQKNLLDQYQAVVTMDADFSHNPKYLPLLLEQLDRFDVVVGSRYVTGGGLDKWSQKRIWLSRFANAYAKFLTGIRLNDLTSGFHCFRSHALQQILRHKISAEGYAFLIELKFRATLEGFRISEIPVVVADRTKGQSKISKRVILESMIIPWKMFYQRLLHRIQIRDTSIQRLAERTQN